jgi:esterase
MKLEFQAQDECVVVNGLRLHYREWGSASVLPAVILHGLTGHAWEFDGVASALARQYHVLAVNQRGHSASSWTEEYSPKTTADDVAALVDILDLGRTCYCSWEWCAGRLSGF